VPTADYHRISHALAWLDANAGTRPSLVDAARAAGLSPAHFQRVFTRWVGISPKRFIQSRIADDAGRLLRNGRATLDAAYAAGLSGNSRLHDLVIHAEAVTPGDVRRGGHGLSISYGWHDTPFGDALLAATTHGICFLAFADRGDRTAALDDLRGRWPNAAFARDDAGTAPLATRAFPGSVSRGGPLALHVRGTNFQLKVWNALLSIPSSATSTYADIADAIGKPSAPRAVGSAVGANPISWLIPCHRVLRGDGALGGYAWGPQRKRVMLAWEHLRGHG
jgi:AraC family transcriptional regulator of adaptative response/methylated-DNA-[protein]-cysteine methyltransferase